MFSFFKKKPKNIPAPLDDSQLEQDAAPIMRDLAADVSQTTPNSAEAQSVAFDFGTLESEALKSEALESEALKSESLDDQALKAAALAATVTDAAITEALAKPTDGEKKSGWLSRLRSGLSRTGQSIGGLFVGVRVDEALFEDLESALIMADAGVQASEALLTALRARVKKDKLEDANAVRQALTDILADHLRILEKPFVVGQFAPLVVMIAGVNGAGKTTSIGKLAHNLQQQGAKVLLAAGDTFRAAAREQLVEWGRRNQVTVIAQEGGDPAAVAFDAVNAGRARGMDVVMIDTAGRLPTQLHLMDELKKIRRVIAKADQQAPHEVLLVVDGNTGQNVLTQIKAFDEAIGLTGLIVTKLDGTAKGGTLAAVAAGSQGVRPVPVYWIGVGESMQDLQPFVAQEFAAAVVGNQPA
jgi:fused signal recognition particle receptor